MRGLVPTVDKALTFDFDTVIPGHGPVSTKADLQKYKTNVETLQTRTRELIKQGVPKDQYLSKLKVDDLGWNLDPATLFVRSAAGAFYDEMVSGAK
jgi:glyoxylase-like metal-dependent hydrolase (beta-lactamase superfamily II)